MNGPVCYMPNHEVDEWVAKQILGSVHKYQLITAYRGMYDAEAAKAGKPTIAEMIENFPKELGEERAKQVAKIGLFIARYRKEIREKTIDAIGNKNNKNIARQYDHLRHVFSFHEREQVLSSASALFSNIVDKLVRNNPQVPRQKIVEGFKLVNGVTVGGLPMLLDLLHQELLGYRQKSYMLLQSPDKGLKAYQKEGHYLDLNVNQFKDIIDNRIRLYTQLLENWDNFIPFLLKDLALKEGIKIGINGNYAVYASEEDYGANNLSEMWELSEAKRDGWQDNNDLQSSFGSVGQRVRRALAKCPKMKATPKYIEQVDPNTGETTKVYAGMTISPVLNDLGFVEYINPVETHQTLADLLRNLQSPDDMIRRLCKPGSTKEARIAWMQPIVDLINDNPQARTEFFVDFMKGFQPYSIFFEDLDRKHGRIRHWKTAIINKIKNVFKNKYEMYINTGKKLPEKFSVWGKPIFSENSKIDWKRLAELRRTVLAWTQEVYYDPMDVDHQNPIVREAPLLKGDDGIVEINGREIHTTLENKRAFLMETLSSLGVDIEVDAADLILTSTDIFDLRKELEFIFDPHGRSGISFVLGNPNFESLTKKTDASQENIEKWVNALNSDKNKKKTWKALYNWTKYDNTPVKEHMVKMMAIVAKHQDGIKMENRARYMENTMYSSVNPCFLSDRLGTIERFVQENDKQGLKRFLQESYLNDPYFADVEYIVAQNAKDETTGKTTDGNDSNKLIRNMWIRELMEACDDLEVPLYDSVAAIFNFERDLGSKEKKFEDFGMSEHALDMFIHYYMDELQYKSFGGKEYLDWTRQHKGTQAENPHKRVSALYPMFIMGDANVSKYIRAPRIAHTIVEKKTDPRTGKEKTYTRYAFDSDAKEQCLDAFWNIYLQEKDRMNLESKVRLQIYGNGNLVEHPDGEFSILTFLNSVKIPKDKEFDERYIKDLIADHLTKAAIDGYTEERNGTLIKVPSFKQRLETLGVLETTKVNGKDTYNDISDIASPENINEKVEDFYWNLALATAQQLQIMTIDPSFYRDTKELQKRYKETHAPGTKLDVTAKNIFKPLPGGDYELFCPERRVMRDGKEHIIEQGMETVAYIRDEIISSEVTNPRFMEAILRMYGRKDKTKEIEEAIENGIVIPKESKEEETKRIDKLADLLGDNYRIYKQYTKNTLTDGQGYRTLESYRMVMGMAGKWDAAMEDAYDRINAIREKYRKENKPRPFTQEELDEISACMVVLQPIKPYNFTHEKYPISIERKNGKGSVNAYMTIPVQHKYSEAIIIPELLPEGTKLADLGYWMEENQVDLVGSDTIAKVGCFGQADLRGVIDNPSLVESMNKAYIHEISYGDYRIQTNVPEHINSSQLFGTQIRKLIMTLLSKSDYSDYVGVEKVNLSTSGDPNDPNRECPLTAKNLLALYNSLICANIVDSNRSFSDNIKDIEKVSELLQQATIGASRESMDNLLSFIVTGNEEAAKKFLIPLFEGGLEHDTAALVLSIFKKIVNKQQISGGSAVQVSAFGIDGYERDGGLRFVEDPDNKENILYAEVEMPFDLSVTVKTTNAEGKVISKKKVDLNFSQYCFETGYLKPSEEVIPRDSAEWKEYQSYTYKRVNGELVPCEYTDPQAEVHKPLIEKDYPGILGFVAYRIPTENDYSMLNCKVKRFTQKIAGGTIRVPLEGTSIAGFDFDIDKLYFMRREFVKTSNLGAFTEKDFSRKEASIIFKKIYERYPGIKKRLTRLRNAYEAKHPEMKDKTTLESYWKAAKLEEENPNWNKDTLFIGMAAELGYAPEGAAVIESLDEYDFTKSPDENSKVARNNLLITLMQKRLSDPETLHSRYTPGGFHISRRAARLFRELKHGDLSTIVKDGVVDLKALEKRTDPKTDPEPNYSPIDPYTLLYYNQQNQLASKLIGIFANQNTHHAFTSALDEFKLKAPIEFCGKSYDDFLHKDNPELAELSRLYTAEFLAASVDAVKDPVLNYLNINTITADAGAMLARLGYTPTEIGLLFNQPIIQKICDEAIKRGQKAETVIKTAISDLSKYIKKGSNNSSLDENTLALTIINERQWEEGGNTRDKFLEENATQQLEVLSLFQDILLAAQGVSDFISTTKFTASNAVSSTFGGMYAKQLKAEEFISKLNADKLPFKAKINATGPGMPNELLSMSDDYKHMLTNEKEYLRKLRFNPFAYEQAMFDTNRLCLKSLAKYYPYETDIYISVRETMQELARYGSLSEDEINMIHRHVIVGMLATQKDSLFYGEGTHVRNGTALNMTHREYYLEHFAGDLAKILADEPELMNLEIFSFITPTLRTDKEKALNKDVWSIELLDIGGMESTTSDLVRDSWSYLMEVNDDGTFKNPKYALLGRDLFLYCFYRMGFDFSPMSFMHLAPTAVKDFITVERSAPLAVKPYTTITPASTETSDDVLVYSEDDADYARSNFDVQLPVEGKLIGQAFCLPKELTQESVKSLILTAKSRPEHNFKIKRVLTDAEMQLFTQESTGYALPENILFNEESLEAASPETIDGLNYGRQRSYRQFLYEILEGKSQGLNINDFCQMWVLNNLDNPRFVLDQNKCSKSCKSIIKRQLDDPNNMKYNKNGEIIGVSDILYFDLSKEADSSSSPDSGLNEIVSFNRDAEGNITSGKWCPVIKIDGEFYMPVGNGPRFNITTGNTSKIAYKKMEPLGCHKVLRYGNGKKLVPSISYKSSMDDESPAYVTSTLKDDDSFDTVTTGKLDNSSLPQSTEGTTAVPAPPTTTNTEPSDGTFGQPLEVFRDIVLHMIADEMAKANVKYGRIKPSEVEQYKRDLVAEKGSLGDDELQGLAIAIRKACREDNILVLDAYGNLVENC